MTVVKFPRCYRHPLPEDAIPRGRDRHATVCPLDGKWALIEQDDGGGFIASGLTKRQAIQSALEIVMEYRGTMTVLNHNPDDAIEGSA
jgi:hypothetical protein